MSNCEGGKGGNINIVSGVGGVFIPTGQRAINGSIRFLVPPNGATEPIERIRIDPDGKFYVNGKTIATDMALYEAMQVYFSTAVTTEIGGHDLDGFSLTIKQEG